ncbi:ferredoxin [Amycolatopsis australiensis]|uniref:Ferredoxin n=1 Tax=Amycolatopsis australiensis TaxID=546364 RepID=A0A1K1RLR7_9PSEU|nr:ferredoxin [Amycolatopsis australiensis]SFW73017.1 Ferredoxin [Amycolatopsis australiensis]
MRVAIEQERCVTSGRCAFTAPEVFTQNDDGLVEVLTERPAADQQEAVREAAFLCPALAIEVKGD